MRERHTGLVSCETLLEHLDDEDWVVFDCRARLNASEWGPQAWQKAHIPGAHHAHLERDLSDPVGDGTRGRHPLPEGDRFAAWLARHGVTPGTQVVCYDDEVGQWAARLWWLCRHHGIPDVAVLDGGLRRWRALGLPCRGGREQPRGEGRVTPDACMPTVDEEEILGGRVRMLLDARAPERYRGEMEPIDPAAGHIPGARNLPFADNVDPDGVWLGPDELAMRFEEVGAVGATAAAGAGPVVAGGVPGAAADGVAVYCGSGVTASHLVLAMEVAGLGTPALYPGSWSAWCHPEGGRPVEDGDSRAGSGAPPRDAVVPQ